MQTANLTRVVVTDEETRGSCAVSSYLVSCGQAEQEARPGATVQLRPGGGAACRVRIVHTIAGKEEPSLTTDWSPAFTPATTHLQLLQTQPMVWKQKWEMIVINDNYSPRFIHFERLPLPMITKRPEVPEQKRRTITGSGQQMLVAQV